MKSLISLSWTLLVSLSLFAASDLDGVKALAKRVSPNLAKQVTFVHVKSAAADVATIAPRASGGFEIAAPNARTASLALGYYVRNIAKGHVSWCGNRIPQTWTLPTEKVEVKPLYPIAMAYNYCTLSYTMAFWDQPDWQKEIDRLALQGYNAALVTVGLQKVWDLTLAEMGYTPEQRAAFIADDAASAWWHMGNLQGLGAPVSAEQIEKDAALGKWLVKAMREVGIEPVFQGFVGLIPSSTTEAQLKGARIFRTGVWCEQFLKSPDILDPTCEAFREFTKVWHRNLKKVYGLTKPQDYPKYLGGDLFHESAPPSSMSADEQTACAVNVQKYQQEDFPGVTWVLQSWQGSPVQNLQNGLDPRWTLIQQLDQTMSNTGATWRPQYRNEKTGAYLPWIWVEVLNFGGNTGMHGAFRRFRNMGHLLDGLAPERVKAFRGYGLLSEGLETNPSSYDMFAGIFTQPNVDSQNISEEQLSAYLADYRLRRYGYTDDHLKAAQDLCAKSVWDCAKDQQGTVESVFCAHPAWQVSCVSTWGPMGGTPYPRAVLVKAAQQFLLAAKKHPKLFKLETFRYDFVEIFQQVLADKAREVLPRCQQDVAARKEFLDLLYLCDAMLMYSKDWRMDAKEARVRAKGGDAGVAVYRRMITTWTPPERGRTCLAEYAHRSYAGLMRDYYGKRWQDFFGLTDYQAPTVPQKNPILLAKLILKAVAVEDTADETVVQVQEDETRGKWVANVTTVENAREDSPGTKYETLSVAIQAVEQNPKARLWLIDKALPAPEGWQKTSSPYGCELRKKNN